jgi:hypothetical protein
MKKLLSIAFLATLFIAGCKKPDFNNDVTGEGLGEFQLRTPANATNLVLNAATPNTLVDITWTAAKPGLNTAPSYSWVAAPRGGDLNNPLVSVPANNSGKDTKLTLTFKQIDDVLKSKGIADGAKADLIWSVLADNGTTKVLATESFNISITRMRDGASPFDIYAPVSSTATVELDPGSTTNNVNFRWQRSTPGSTANPVRYRVFFYPEGSNTPIFSVASNNAGVDTFAVISHKQMSDSLRAKGYTNESEVVKMEWRAQAVSGTWAQWSNYSNKLYILRDVKIYLVGGATPADWTPANAIQMIKDTRFSGTYWIYVTLKTGGFKFLNQREWPGGPLNSTDYGQRTGGAPAGTLGTNAQGNTDISVSTPGVYRITVDINNMKWYLQNVANGGVGMLGMVGGFQGWNPSANARMSYLDVNKFINIVNMSTGDGFKFHDGAEWNNSAPDKPRWYGLDGTQLKEDGGSLNDIKWTGANGRVRVIFDGTDVKNFQYQINSGSEMRVVGDGMAGVNAWDPGSSPQMTYAGNGVWTITLNLVGGKDIKFLAGNAWGAFDYEDAGGGKIKWDGGPNFKTPATSGSYTITLNEFAGTVTIN